MFPRLATLALPVAALAALAAVAAAAPGSIEARQTSQCNTGSLSCCNQVLSSTDPTTTLLTGLLGIVLSGITGEVGLNCSPIDILGVGGNSCTQQPVCCTGNNFNGLINVGCTPINLNL